jgi:hypothetical protein
MGKRGDYLTVLGIVVSFFLFAYLFSGSFVRLQLGPGHDAVDLNQDPVPIGGGTGGDVQLSPISDSVNTILNDCTEIEAQWNDIFDVDDQDIDEIHSFEGDADYGCEEYLAWQDDGSRFYVLAGSTEVNDNDDSVVLIAIGGDFTESFKGNITDFGDGDMDGSQVDYLVDVLADIESYSVSRSSDVSDDDEAVGQFDVSFKVGNSSDFSLSGDVYEFEYYNESLNNGILTELSESGGVHVSNDTEYIFIEQTRELYVEVCEVNWTAVEGECSEDDEMEVWYNDTNSCDDDTDQPDNETEDCDYDNLGIIGDDGDYEDDGEELDLFIDGDEVDFDEKYDEDYEVEFVDDDGDVRVAFDWDFEDEPLNLRDIEIEIQGSNSDFGFIIVNGIDEDKTVWVDRKDSDSDFVCVEDDDISSISSISSICGRSDEIIVPCPGSNDDYDCSISGGRFEVVGLEHSGVREVLPEDAADVPNPGCTPNWDYSGWSSCTNGLRTRTATDLNNCGTSAGRQALSEACISPPTNPSCEADWDCTPWDPAGECPEEGYKTRTCTDTNDCGTNIGKPAERFNCEEPGSNTFAIVMIIVLSVLIIGTVVVLVILIKKRERDKRRQMQRSNVQLTQGMNRFGR